MAIKSRTRNLPPHQSRQVISALILVGILSLSMGTLMATAGTIPSERLDKGGFISQSGRDRTGRKLSTPVAKAVLRSASQQLKLPTSQLHIVRAEKQTWQDGCLGLARSGEVCTQALIPGYKVTVEGGHQRLVYRTNASGSVLRPDEASQNDTKSEPVPIPKSELPSSLTEGAIFRATASGGIMGRTTETTLMQDGRVIQVSVNLAGTAGEPQIHQISQQQVHQFQQLLQPLAQFKGLSYPAPRNAADYITVSLTSHAGTIRYADLVRESLPKPLQQVIQSWNQIQMNTPVGQI